VSRARQSVIETYPLSNRDRTRGCPESHPLKRQAELVSSRFCKTKCFDDDRDAPLGLEDTGGAWLSVIKSAYDPPPFPESLLDGVQLSPNPSKRPSPKLKISKRHRYDEDPARLLLYDEYRKA
jgi:hypothetical protein